MTTIKRIVAITTVIVSAVLLVGPAIPSAQAMTAEELQAQIAQLQAQLSALQTQLVQIEGTGTTGAGLCLSANLKLGTRSVDVTTLQTGLAKDATVYPQGLVTGYFGALTKAAVAKFQEKYASSVLAPFGLTQ